MTDTDTDTPHLTSLAAVGDLSSFPTHGELSRTLLASEPFATLTTTTSTGHPYGSLAAYSTLEDGSPLLCISEFAEHTKNAHLNPAAGLFVAARNWSDPMDAPRVSLIGDLVEFAPTGADVSRHIAAHPGAADYADWSDFGWWRLAVSGVRYVGGFGSMSWVDGAELAAASADPIAASSPSAVQHMNDDHAESNLAMVRAFASPLATSATMRDLDRHGMTFYADTPDGWTLVRIAFPDGPLGDPTDIRPAVVAAAKRAAQELQAGDGS